MTMQPSEAELSGNTAIRLHAGLDSWLDRVPPLRAEELRIQAEIARPIAVDSPASTIVRGLMLARLREMWCSAAGSDCPSCASGDCPYAQLAETRARFGDGSHGSHAPHPFWIRGVPALGRVERGLIVVRLILIGPARKRALELDLALRDALSRLGATRKSGAVTLGSTERSTFDLFGRSSSRSDTYHMELASPLIAELGDHDRRLCPEAPWLPMLARAAARRITLLLRAFEGVTLPKIDYPSAYDVNVTRGELRRWSATRFSRRQQRRHPLAGWTGIAEISGRVLETIGPLLECASRAQLGKHTAFGFGHIRVRPEARSDG